MNTKLQDSFDELTDDPEIYKLVLDGLPHCVLMLDGEDQIEYGNMAAEAFLSSSASFLKRNKLGYFLPFGSPVLALVRQVRNTHSPINEYKVDVSSPRIGQEKLVDVYVGPVGFHPVKLIVMFQVRNMAEKIDRQLIHRNAARAVTGLASMLGHEIKNPLSGIRGAAQLLESTASDEDKALAQLIMSETDRIVNIINRMEVFSDKSPIVSSAINIHKVLERVKGLSENGFAKNIRIEEAYDPSLPPVLGNFDQLVQVLLNLSKNAAEALSDTDNPTITFSTAFRHGIHLSTPGSNERISLPLEICVKDNGPGIPDEIRNHIFDPFVTSKTNGSGLGLALVAKIIGDHGGVVECESSQHGTIFRILMPTSKEASNQGNEAKDVSKNEENNILHEPGGINHRGANHEYG